MFRKYFVTAILAVVMWMPVSVPVAAVSGILIGCSTGAQQTTYRTSSITHASVRAAMGGWNQYVAAGKATIQDEQKVKAAYEKYRQAQLAVINIAQSYGRVGQIDPTTQDQFQAALDASGKALAELLGLLNTFGIKE